MVPVPDIVVVGIGDSGTSAVKLALENLGVDMCGVLNNITDVPTKKINDGLGHQDNWYTMATQEYIPSLLWAAHGRTSDERGYRSSGNFSAAVKAEAYGALMSYNCITTRRFMQGNLFSAPPKWGFKNPKHIHLLPVMDEAFRSKERILAVARDPRDICGGENQEQFELYSGFLAVGEHVKGDKLSECYAFVASIWISVLRSYGSNPRFRIVRIEDLVAGGDTAAKVMNCVLEHAKVSPRANSITTRLKLLRKHSRSYLCGMCTKGAQSWRERSLQTVQNAPEVRETMIALGYGSKGYGLETPGAAAVCRP